MRNNFFVLNIRQILKYSLLMIVTIISVGFGINYTDRAIETVSNNRLLPIYSVDRDDNKVALTFDCAWGAGDIKDIVETLDNNGIRATFFTVGTWVDKNPEAVKLILEYGHDIGNHSNTHAHVNKMPREALIEDINKCNNKITNITGEKVTLYRGPYGEYNNTVISSANELGMHAIQWDVDTLDYLGKSVDEMCSRIKDKIRSGSIILMHNDTENTSKGLQKIIDTIEELGYEIVPVSELIYKDSYTIDNIGRQIKM